MADIVRFIKAANGNVLLQKNDETLIASFNPAQNLLRIPEDKNKFKIQSVSAFGNNALVLDYTQVDLINCSPPIVAANFNEFLIELSRKFFFLDSDSAGAAQNNVVKQLIIEKNNLPPEFTEQDICNYILALPEAQRTIAETDSKWNVIIGYFAS